MPVTWEVWSDAICVAVKVVPDDLLLQVARTIRDAEIVITAGNGGSSALASHAAQALSKPGYVAGGGVPAFCLTDAVETLTAHANDGGWVNALEEMARPYAERLRCALVLFSSSGKSGNVVRLARLARGHGHPVVAFTGFDGGPLRELATVSIHVDSDDYEVVEPVHDALLHRVQAHFRELMAVRT